jgi:hypothetical protein
MNRRIKRPGSDDKADPDAMVGYRRPPIHTQFKRGQSGNPKGRPKAKLNVAPLMKRIFTEQVTFREGDRVRKMSKFEAMHYSQIHKAIKGDSKAFSTLVGLVEEDPGFAPQISPIRISFSKPDGTVDGMDLKEWQEWKDWRQTRNSEKK